MVIDPNILFMEQFECWLLEHTVGCVDGCHHLECDLYSIARNRIFKMVLEIVGGPWLLELFQIEYFIALPSFDIKGVLMMGIFGCCNKGGNF